MKNRVIFICIGILICIVVYSVVFDMLKFNIIGDILDVFAYYEQWFG